MKESRKSVNELIDSITQTNAFKPIDNPNSTGLSPDLSDEDIAEVIGRAAKKKSKECTDGGEV